MYPDKSYHAVLVQNQNVKLQDVELTAIPSQGSVWSPGAVLMDRTFD